MATLRPEVRWQANVGLTSFWRMTHGHNPASHLDPPVNRRIAEVAIQYRLGHYPMGGLGLISIMY
jgi:hypothetical protein